jgi:hypothetical protein
MAAFTDPERDERRALLQAAAGGSMAAQLKLQTEYHARVYTLRECKQIAGKIRLGAMRSPGAIRRKVDHIIDNTGGERMRSTQE